MNKIGIVTLHGNENYGNKLQNFALQEALKKLGYQSETLIFANDKPKNRKDFIKEIIKKIFSKAKETIHFKKTNLKRKRQLKFVEFSKNHLCEVEKINKNGYEYISKEYKTFFVGSDQVWNPGSIREGSINFLNFAEFKKRNSYAASFGVDILSEEEKKKVKILLSNMNNISVREDQGKQIVFDLINRDVPKLVDPVFLLSKEEWSVLAEKSKQALPNDFILVYFLGVIPNNAKSIIEKFKSNNKKIIYVGDNKVPEHYINSPIEFINLIKNSQLFLTDSFHGVAFSIIFETPFYVFNREGTSNMFSRIETILKTFNLSERYLNDNKTLKEECFDINFENAINIISEEKSKALKFLEKAIETS